MILPDHEIRRLCTQAAMVVPYNPELQNPASLDVLLGDRLMVEVEDRAGAADHGHRLTTRKLIRTGWHRVSFAWPRRRRSSTCPIMWRRSSC
jgi:hypothetical protein